MPFTCYLFLQQYLFLVNKTVFLFLTSVSSTPTQMLHKWLISRYMNDSINYTIFRTKWFRLGKLYLQFSSVAQLCPTLCDPMNCSTPGLPVHHQLPEFTQTHVHWVGDAIQPSHHLSAPSPPGPHPSQHQSLFQWVTLHTSVSWTISGCTSKLVVIVFVLKLRF